MVVCHIFLYVFRVVWNDFVAEHTATIGCYENVVLETYSSEILVCFQQVVVKEVAVQTACTPVVNECRNEVDARFVGHYEALLQSLSAAQACRAELFRWLYLVIETYVVLS